jgi:phytoene dehydrogenase-like protein
MENWRCGSGTFRMNVALSELRDFTALPGRAPAEHHASGIIIAPSLAYMEQAFARSFGWSRRPIIELVIPSTIDDTLAPRGQHVASLFCSTSKPSSTPTPKSLAPSSMMGDARSHADGTDDRGPDHGHPARCR